MPKIGARKKKIETTLAQHWQVGARHAQDRGREKKIETTLAQQFDFVSQAMHIARASRHQSVQSSPKRKASSDKVFFDGFHTRGILGSWVRFPPVRENK